jgi:hypothetical protein
MAPSQRSSVSMSIPCENRFLTRLPLSSKRSLPVTECLPSLASASCLIPAEDKACLVLNVVGQAKECRSQRVPYDRSKKLAQAPSLSTTCAGEQFRAAGVRSRRELPIRLSFHTYSVGTTAMKAISMASDSDDAFQAGM